MTKEDIWHFWESYEETGDIRFLVEILQRVDFGDEGDIRNEICKILMKSAGKRSDYFQKIRDRDINRVHQINLNNGDTITNSYDKIADKLGLSADAVRKVIEKSAEKPD